MYKIGLFSKITKTTIKTLRYYDEVGLLIPAFIDDNGYRYYTSEQLIQLHKIIALKQLGLSIDEILSIISGQNIDNILEKRKSEIIVQMNENIDQLSRIQNFIEEKKEGLDMKYQTLIKELPECIVYSKRTIIPNYDTYFELIPSIGETVKKANPNIKCRVPEYCFVIYHDGEYKDKNIDIEYCEAVTEMGNNVDDIIFKRIPAVMAASVMHKGPYRELGQAYSYIFKWIEDNGYTAIDNPRESYIDGIWNKDNEQDWLTEIQVPIAKK